MSAYLDAVWTVLLELAPWLWLGAAVAAIMHVALPRDFVRRSLSGRGGVLKAVLLGVPLPLCSCGVIPAGLGLKRDGASNGASIGFMVATPQTGVDSVLVSASFLGWPFALFKVLSALGLGLVAGFATDRLAPDESDAASTEPTAAPDRGRRSWREGISHGVEIIRTIWGWLVFGVLASAAITVLLPSDAFAGLSAYGGLAAMAVMLVVSLPMYVCATTSVPIAAALVAGGFPAGAALVFLMAGPATNLATLGAVKRAFGLRAVAVYVTTVALGSVLLGWAFDFVLDPGAAHHAMTAHEHGGSSIIAAVAAVALLGAIAYFAFEDARAWLGKLKKSGGGARVEVGVDGLTCNGCVRKLEGRLAELPGATGIEVQREPAGVCRVEGVAIEDVRAAIERAGFRPT
ncbi:MAG: permease [Sandaracinaceae bacterium]